MYRKLLVTLATVLLAGVLTAQTAMQQYIVALRPSAPDAPDFSALGATIDLRQGDTIILRAPAAAIKQLQRHPSVRYVKPIVRGSAAAVGISDTRQAMTPGANLTDR